MLLVAKETVGAIARRHGLAVSVAWGLAPCEPLHLPGGS